MHMSVAAIRIRVWAEGTQQVSGESDIRPGNILCMPADAAKESNRSS